MTTIEPKPDKSDDLLAELKKKRRKRKIIIGAVIVGILSFVGICLLVVFFTGQFGIGSEVVTEFLQEMSEKDIDSAYELMSEKAKIDVTKADLRELVDGENFVLFDGFQEITLKKIGNRKSTTLGAYLEIEGLVNYEDGFEGSFIAIVQREGWKWKITWVNVFVGPDKMEAFLEKNGD